jgi:lipopolysaccharide/colanic/teichoic acid biosynthesis glycosyltransferase
MYKTSGKRIFDFVLVSLALILLTPVLGVTAFLVRLKMGSPILFRQKRPGLHGEPFIIYKFRTMSNARDSDGNLLPDAERLTRFGKFLRSTSLDELPELWNILKGDMSLVGPRPLLMRYMPYFSEEEKQRFLVRPGLTGLAQISGRNNLTWDDRLATDVQYVQACSFVLDLKILMETVRQVLVREGIEVNPSATMLDLDVERFA